MYVKNQFLSFGNFILQNGMQIRFWEDIWLGSSTLKEQYLNFYNIIRSKNATFLKTLLFLIQQSILSKELICSQSIYYFDPTLFLNDECHKQSCV
jgi:hypothetical protein